MTPRLAILALAALLALPAAAADAAPAAPSTPSTPSAPGDAARVAVGGEIPFDDLYDYVGAEVEVSTKFRTVRRGTLEGASSIAINLRLPASERGLLLGMSRESIVKVVLVADRPAKP